MDKFYVLYFTDNYDECKIKETDNLTFGYGNYNEPKKVWSYQAGININADNVIMVTTNREDIDKYISERKNLKLI